MRLTCAGPLQTRRGPRKAGVRLNRWLATTLANGPITGQMEWRMVFGQECGSPRLGLVHSEAGLKQGGLPGELHVGCVKGKGVHVVVIHWWLVLEDHGRFSSNTLR